MARKVAGLGVLAWLASAVALRAEPAPPFAVLWREIQATAPRLREGEADVEAAQGLAEQARARPNPTLGVQAENLGETPGSVAPPQTTVSLSQPLELGGKRAARIASGQAEVGAAEARRRQSEADFAHDLAVAYTEAEAAQAHAKVLAEDLGRAREDLQAAQALVRAGREADVRSVQAAAAERAAEADLQSANADFDAELAKLSSLAGASPPFTGLDATLLDRVADLPPPPLVLGDGDTQPAVLVAQAEREAAARKVQVERSRAVSDVTVMAGVRRIDGFSSTAGVVGVSVPLPLFDRNQGSVAAASAQLAAAEARLRMVELETLANWNAAAAKARAATGRLSAAEDGLKAADEAYRLTRIGYDRGKLSLTDLLAARRAASEAALRLLDARLSRVSAEIELARIAGRIPFGG